MKQCKFIVLMGALVLAGGVLQASGMSVCGNKMPFCFFSTQGFSFFQKEKMLQLPPQSLLFKKNKKYFKEVLESAWQQRDPVLLRYLKNLDNACQTVDPFCTTCPVFKSYNTVKSETIIAFQKEGFEAAHDVVHAGLSCAFKKSLCKDLKNCVPRYSYYAHCGLFSVVQEICPPGWLCDYEDTREKWERYVLFKQVLDRYALSLSLKGTK